MSLRLTADFHALDELLARAEKVDAGMRVKVFAVVEDVATRLDARIDGEMPKDTGRAAASWGKYNPALLSEGATRIVDSLSSSVTRPSKRTGRMQQSSEADSIWAENPEGLYIIEGTHVPYVEALNEGHSTQAPAGFIDMATEWAQQEINVKGAEMLERELGKI